MTPPPITISVMLACYATVAPDRYVILGEWNSPAGIKSRRWLQENGLIDEDHGATEKGRAWVHHICSTPVPISTWVLPERDGDGDVVFPDIKRHIDEYAALNNPIFAVIKGATDEQ